MRLRRVGVPAEVAGRRMLADRDSLAVTAIFYLIVSAVLSALWRAAAGEGQIAGYTAAALTWYIVTAELATCALNVRLIEEVGDEIGSGAVAVEMLRPVPVIAVRLVAEVGRGVARLAILVGPGAAMAWLLVGPPPSAAGVALAVPALVLAVSCNLCLQHACAAAAFWLRDTRAMWFLYQKFVFLLGGMLLPLEVLPDALNRVAMALPFMTMAYAPARLAAGHVEPALLLVQLGWLAVLASAAALAFARGQRRLQVVGG